MRIFTERNERSPFAGEHQVYDSTEEFERENPGREWKKWGFTNILELKPGDWIRCDDGYVVEVLRITPMRNDTYFVRVPMGTFAVYMTKSDGWRFRQLCAQFSVPHKGSISQRARIYHGGHKMKIKFAMLVVSGISLTKAVMLSYPNFHRLTKTQLLSKAKKLMEDKVVQSEIRTEVEKFNNSILKKFDDDRLIDQLDLLLERSARGTNAHRENIKFIMELRGLYSSPVSSKKLRKIKEVPFTEVPPSEADK